MLKKRRLYDRSQGVVAGQSHPQTVFTDAGNDCQALCDANRLCDAEEKIQPQNGFSAQEIECMEYQMERLEGGTEKLKNPYTPKGLKRYIWVIARLDGWKGYNSKKTASPPFGSDGKSLLRLCRDEAFSKICPNGSLNRSLFRCATHPAVFFNCDFRP